MHTYVSYMHSPLGRLRLVGDGDVLFSLTMAQQRHAAPDNTEWRRDDAAFTEVRRQLDAYFQGGRTVFDLPLAPAGTPFQKTVWAALTEIPFGRTEHYGELARRIGSAQSARAVALANARNPIPIIVPCHRVISADGALSGYSAGIERKRWLLRHEGHVLPPCAPRLDLNRQE